MNDCPLLLATTDTLHRTKVLEDLLVRRLVRKSRRVLDTWERAERDWNQTLYEMAAYAMGAPRNSVPFQKLATRVTFRMCMKESGNRHAVESMLLGCSGLLAGEYLDSQIVGMQEDFVYLSNKYDIETMRPGEWNRAMNYPAGNPLLRIAQFAAVVSQEEFCFNNVVACKTLDDVSKIFSAEVSDYWHSCYTLGGKFEGMPKSMGKERKVVMAINLVVPMQFAYGEVMGKDEVKLQAMELLESLPAEHNRIVSKWTGAGVPCTTAFDSQALIELESFCHDGECRQCPLAKQIKRT